jgi:hypothetical protein
MNPLRVFALLGRRDEPTDAVEEYCLHLGEALAAHDYQLELRRVPWEIHGWPRSLHALRLQAAGWRGTWILVQYTALAWSARGFPFRFIQALRILAAAGARITIVYHDVEPFAGTRPVDRLRRFAQVRTMRRALDLADVAVFTVPPEKLSWLAQPLEKAVFIPVGPNLPTSSLENVMPLSRKEAQTPAVAIFSITGGAAGDRETREIISAISFAARELGTLRLSVFGRHAELRESTLRNGLRDLPVEISVEGVLEGNRVVEKLSACDVLLFVRGPISSRRSSAIAGIACGLPVIAYPGPETSPPITEAGVVLVSPDQPDQLHAALVRVLSDRSYREELAERSRAVYRSHFAWSSIASHFSATLKKNS